jgi:hypothetical protein
MDAAFVALGARRGRRLTDAQRALVQHDAPAPLWFDPTDHLGWQSPDESMAIGAWQCVHPHLGGARRWVADPDGVAMCVGMMWPEAGGWPSEADWARRARRGAEHLHGIYAAVTVAPDGTTTAWSDPFGYRFVYYGERDGVGAVGSDARLVAWALTPAGSRPARDPFGACCLAARRQQIGPLTGYRDVSTTLVGERVRLTGDGLRVEQVPHPWIPDDDLRTAGPSALVDRVGAALSSTVRAAVDAPIGRVLFDLTGGKDTRVLLALAIGAGITDRVEFFTVGPPTLGDVQIAEHLAERYGLHHTVERGVPADTTSYREAIRSQVERTCGMASIWSSSRPRPPEDRLRVQGIPGDVLRAHRPLPKRIQTEDEVSEFCTRVVFTPLLGLIGDDEAARRYLRMELELLHHDALSELSPVDRYQAFRSTNLVRSARYGATEQLVDQARVHPFHSATVLAAALALGRDNRHAELAHRELIRAVSPELEAEPMTGADWGMARLPKKPPPDRPPAPRPDGEPLIARGHRLSFDRRRRVFDEIIEDTANPAWSLIDRAKVIDGLDRFGEIRPRARQEIYGALTAALWLAGEDEVVPEAP